MTQRRNPVLLALSTIIVCATLASGVVAAKKQRTARKPSATAASATPNVASSAAPASSAQAPASSASRVTAATPPTPASSSGQLVARQESRIEFDERTVRGQSASGVIYLFQRSPSEFKTIVQVPESFRSRTVEVLAPRRDEP